MRAFFKKIFHPSNIPFRAIPKTAIIAVCASEGKSDSAFSNPAGSDHNLEATDFSDNLSKIGGSHFGSKSLCSFHSFAECCFSYCHRKSVSSSLYRSNVLLHKREFLIPLFDCSWTFSNSGSCVILLMLPVPVQRVQLVRPVLKRQFLDDQRVSGSNPFGLPGLQFDVPDFLQIGCVSAGQSLGDVCGLPLDHLPHITVVRLLLDISVHADALVDVSEADDTPLTLFQIVRAVRDAEMVQGDGAFLRVDAFSHLCGGAYEHPDVSAVHGVVELCALFLSVVILDVCDLLPRDPCFHKLLYEIIV